MNFETMGIVKGKDTALKYKNSGKLPTRKCPVTGSNLEEDIEYGVPREWEEWTEGEATTGALQTTKAAEMQDLIDLGIDPAELDETSTQAPIVKTEPITGAIKTFTKKVEDFTKDKKYFQKVPGVRLVDEDRA
jgi:hypothetical protein